jgi:hypothetical protein
MREALRLGVKAALMVGIPTALFLFFLVGHRGDEAVVVAMVSGGLALLSFLFVFGVNVYHERWAKPEPVRFVGHRGRDVMLVVMLILFIVAIALTVSGR